MLKLWFEAIVCSFKSLSQSQYQLSCDSVLRSAGHEVSSRHCNQAADYLPYWPFLVLLVVNNITVLDELSISIPALFTEYVVMNLELIQMRYKYLSFSWICKFANKKKNMKLFFLVCIMYETVPNFRGALKRSKQLYRHNMNKYFIRYSKYKG